MEPIAFIYYTGRANSQPPSLVQLIPLDTGSYRVINTTSTQRKVTASLPYIDRQYPHKHRTPASELHLDAFDDAVIQHYTGQSISTLDDPEYQYFFRQTLEYLSKHYGFG